MWLCKEHEREILYYWVTIQWFWTAVCISSHKMSSLLYIAFKFHKAAFLTVWTSVAKACFNRTHYCSMYVQLSVWIQFIIKYLEWLTDFFVFFLEVWLWALFFPLVLLSFFLSKSRFLTGPANLKDPDAKFRFPRIFVKAGNSYEELHLIVYKVSVSAISTFVCPSRNPVLYKWLLNFVTYLMIISLILLCPRQRLLKYYIGTRSHFTQVLFYKSRLKTIYCTVYISSSSLLQAMSAAVCFMINGEFPVFLHLSLVVMLGDAICSLSA